MPDPDRRVGRLCAPASRSERPARGELRDAVHVCAGADGIGEAGRQLPAGHQPAGVGYHRLPAHAGGRCGGRWPARAGGARPAAERRWAHRLVVAAGQCRGRVRDRFGRRLFRAVSRDPAQFHGPRRSLSARSPISTAPTTRSFRRSATTPITRNGSRPRTRSIRRSSTASTATGRRW